jgi:phosphoglycolate phosphatase
MNLLFDLDGTLTDPFAGITESILYALNRLGRQKPKRESLGWCIGPPLKESFKKLLGCDDEKMAEVALGHYRERFGSVGLFENEVYKGIPEALGALQADDFTLYVATSKPRVFAKRIVAHFGLEGYFNEIYGSELDGTRSDKASLLAHILETEVIEASQTAMIGDREHDMIGAKENGLSGVGVLWGYGTQAELERSGAGACIRHPSDLKTVFG